MKNLFLILIFFGLTLTAQTYKITYKSFFEGKERGHQDPVIVFANGTETFILTEKILSNSKEIPFEVQKINRTDKAVTQYGFVKDQQISTYTDLKSIPGQTFELKPETKKILGYSCRKAVTSVNSNTMEVWYTNDLKIKGGPSLLGQDLGLVLEIVRNGNSSTKAVKIEKVKDFGFQNILKGKNITGTDELSHKDLLWKSRFTTLNIFNDEVINFSDQSKSSEEIKRFANGTIILKKVNFPEIKDGSNIFAQLTAQSSGDAYDRTGTVFVIPQDKELSFFDALLKGADAVPVYDNGNGKIYKGIAATEKYQPAGELMRFFTPFGVNQFNHIQLKGKEWQNGVMYRQDISELQPLLSGKELWTGVFIGNYDKGGHKVSLEITIHNDGINIFKNNYSDPLFNSLNIMEMAGQDYSTMFDSPKGLTVGFALEKDLKNATLRFITTGHGGWENGDEFVPKENRIFLDGKMARTFTPWRTDCGSYRLYNPASGNFPNGLSSSDYSRSNWCPGTVTNPNYISLGDLKAGTHTLQIQIPQGKNEGSSFSSWNVSGILMGEQ